MSVLNNALIEYTKNKMYCNDPTIFSHNLLKMQFIVIY